MASRLDIINSALAELAQEPIEADPLDQQIDTDDLTSLLEDETAQSVYRIYPQVKADLLNAHPWTWLTIQRNLLGADPHDRNLVPDGSEHKAWPHRYRWNKPRPEIGSIRALYVGPVVMEDRPQVSGWRVEGEHIFTDFSPVIITYQGEIAEETWPQMFVNAVVLALASRLSLPITYDIDTARLLERRAETALTNAKRIDSQSHPPEAITDFSFVTAHWGGDDYGMRNVGRGY